MNLFNSLRERPIPLTEFMVTVMLAVPEAAPETIPAEVMTATAGFEELHVTERVMFCIAPSLRVPLR